MTAISLILIIIALVLGFTVDRITRDEMQSQYSRRFGGV